MDTVVVMMLVIFVVLVILGSLPLKANRARKNAAAREYVEQQNRAARERRGDTASRVRH